MDKQKSFKIESTSVKNEDCKDSAQGLQVGVI